jgi:uncharacterized membrane protein YdjX (TVP38/TMEM64 family)
MGWIHFMTIRFKSMPMAVLGGALFGTWVGLTAVCVCTAFGASTCYFLSWLFCGELVAQYLSERIRWWKEQVQEHRHHVVSYVFVLRLTPVFPGWFLNIAAAHVGIPVASFIVGTMMGRQSMVSYFEIINKNKRKKHRFKSRRRTDDVSVCASR